MATGEPPALKNNSSSPGLLLRQTAVLRWGIHTQNHTDSVRCYYKLTTSMNSPQGPIKSLICLGWATQSARIIGTCYQAQPEFFIYVINMYKHTIQFNSQCVDLYIDYRID